MKRSLDSCLDQQVNKSHRSENDSTIELAQLSNTPISSQETHLERSESTSVSSQEIEPQFSQEPQIEGSESTSVSSQEVDNVPQLERSGNTFILSDIEKQVIRRSLAMLCRTNASDWQLFEEDSDYMFLKENCVLFCPETFTRTECEINSEVCYNLNTTVCRVMYNTPTLRSFISYSWNNENDSLTITKECRESYYMVFSKMVSRSITLTPENCREDSWCYFREARYHLQSIYIV